MTKRSVSKLLPVPDFFNSANAGKWSYQPDQSKLLTKAAEWRRVHDIKPSGGDSFRIHILFIDGQNDFCLPPDQGGALFVGGRSGRGAINDNAGSAKFIYENLWRITQITTTMDTHFAFQLFFPGFWFDGDGKNLQPHTMIVPNPKGKGGIVNVDGAGNVLHESIRPDPAMTHWLCQGNYTWLVEYVEFYCKQLAKKGRYVLYLWPPHTILGSQGHALVGVIHEARMFHSFVRGAQSDSEIKGGHPLTENYSVLCPEIVDRHDGKALTQRNARFFSALMEADAVIVLGQAKSHCVLWTLTDLLEQIAAQDPKLAKKVYVPGNLTSSVVVPGVVDFTDQTEVAFKKLRDAGMNIVDSNDPIESWPGMGL